MLWIGIASTRVDALPGGLTDGNAYSVLEEDGGLFRVSMI